MIFAKLVELVKVLIHGNAFNKAEGLLREVISPFFTELCTKAAPGSEEVGWLSAAASRLVELVSICTERNLDVALVVKVFPAFLGLITEFVDSATQVGS